MIWGSDLYKGGSVGENDFWSFQFKNKKKEENNDFM